MTPETLLKRDIKRVLSAFGWFNWHNRQGLGSYPGIPDIIATRKGQILFIEAKSKRGKQSPKQKAFQENLEYHGFTYLLIDDIKDLICVLDMICVLERG